MVIEENIALTLTGEISLSRSGNERGQFDILSLPYSISLEISELIYNKIKICNPETYTNKNAI